MRWRGLSDSRTAVVLVVGILVGAGAYYLTTTYSLSLAKTETVTRTTTQEVTTVQTSLSTSTWTTTQYVTQVQTTLLTSTSTTSVYPIPKNVTVSLLASGQFANYAINAGSYSASGSLGDQQSFSVTPVFQGETITVSITLNCPGSTGPTATASLYVDGTLVSRTSVACGGTTTGQISYIL